MARATTSSQSVLKYVPGVCNIGPSERAKRRQSGLVALLITALVLVILFITSASKGWRLLLILPVAAAAVGFLQDSFHFCVGFGFKGLYNVLHEPGRTDTVTTEEFRRQDRHKAMMIIGLSLVIGLIVTGLSLLA